MCRNRVRALAPGELMLPDVSGFILVINSRFGAAAEALASDVNLALLELFFGSDCLNGLTQLFRAVPLSEIRDVEFAAPDTVCATPAEADAEAGTERTADAWRAPGKVAASGFATLKPGFLPMLNLQKQAPSIFMCGAVSKIDGQTVFGAAALKGCDAKDRCFFDVALLEYSLGFARQIVPTKFAAAICASVSFETLAWSRGRQAYQNALRSADVANMPFLILKIEDVPAGTPAARLAEIVAMVRPFVKRVFVQLPDSFIGLAQSGHIGAAGLCVTLPAHASPAAIVRLAHSLVRAAAIQQAVSCVDAVDNPLALPLLRAAGIRFAAGRADDENIHLDLPLAGDCVSSAHAA